MAEGSDGDDDELVEIELEEVTGEAPVPPRAPPPPAVPPVPAAPPRPVPPAVLTPAAAAVPTQVPAAGSGPEGEVELADLLEVRQPIVEAAETDARVDRTLFESEAAAAVEPSRRAALLLEVGRLVEAEGDEEAARTAARDAFAADPSLTVTLWGLRRLLSRAGLWQELAEAYRVAAEAVPTTASGEARARRARADLLIERGRLLEDRLQRDTDALASYE
jgi:tetratricopeptide (TPR) repeat protein